MDLSKLTKNQKLELLDQIEEKERRLREQRAVYTPNSGQSQVHSSRAQTRAVFSGNGGGKTALAVNEALWAARGYNPILEEFTPVPARIIVLLDHPEKVTDLWLPEIRKWANIQPEQLHKRGKPYVNHITFKNGSEILFMFHAQDPLIFESIELDVLICDEPPPRHAYIGLRRGARKKGRKPRFLLVGTPLASTWMYKDLWVPWEKGEMEDVECFRYGTETNRSNLAPGYIEQMEAVLSEKEALSRLKGHFFELDGLALAHLFDRNSHIIPKMQWDANSPCVVVIDPHPSKAHHAILVGADKDNYLYYIDEFKAKAVARNFIKLLIQREWFSNYRVIDIVYDSLGNADMTGGEGFKSFGTVINEVLKENSLGRARATTYNEKNDEEFIERIRDALLIPAEANNFGHFWPKLRIFQGNKGIISDIENVQWAQYSRARGIDDPKPKLEIQNKDFLSCLKYALATNLYYKKAKSKIFIRTKPVKTYGIQAPKARPILHPKLRRR